MTARAHTPARLRLEPLEDRSNPSTAYLATDLIADQPGIAPITDPTLVNAWGISLNPNGAFWVSANGADLSEVYGNNGGQLTQPFKVNVPGGAPTGQVFNGTAGDFFVSGVNASGDPASAKSAFIFASESGQITAWSPGIYPAKPAAPGVSTNAITGFSAPDGAVYKGLALAQVGGANFLFAADFHNNKIDVFDGNFQKVALGSGAFESFTDPNMPAGYAPFNVALIGTKLYVSYAKQDADAHDDVAGRGHGLVSVFETNGHFDGRLVSGGDLNSPWGMVQAPASFGDFANALLVGNFGDGKIHAYDIGTGKELGTMAEAPGRPIVIDGLWGLSFGNAKTAQGGAETLFYAAGPDGEAHGLFGKITANAAGTNPVSAVLTGGDLVITGSRDGERVEVKLEHGGQRLVVESGGQKIGTFDAAAVGTIHFNGLAGNDVFTVDRHVTATVIADGGAGNDILAGGGGSNVLVGNAGDDILAGGASRDILVGGAERDLLFGFGDDDILIGGSTAYDSNPAALTQILGVWNSGMSYNDRVDAIRAGTGGVPKLDAATVADDGSRDDLFGGRGLDWFFTSDPDRIHGKKGAERVN
jgi:uncharacterized protein (TIGR03118 family)